EIPHTQRAIRPKETPISPCLNTAQFHAAENSDLGSLGHLELLLEGVLLPIFAPACFNDLAALGFRPVPSPGEA
ncbi:MAG: hypothetical protein ACYCSN_19675, partial [Acidobacteriaceae bacterium]